MTRGRGNGRDELPTTFVPRWLAAAVLAALLASGALSAWLVIASKGDAQSRAEPTASAPPDARADE
jgi:hypothetical protein